MSYYLAIYSQESDSSLQIFLLQMGDLHIGRPV